MMAMPTPVSRALPAAALCIVVASSVTAVPARAVASSQRYEIQRDTSEVTFLATSLLANANGKFHRFSGEVVADPLTREIAVPVDLQISATDLVARGEFTVNRVDYGIKYQSFLNPVNDTVRIAFVLRGRSRSPQR
jgi:polyisoprenoid-binding protein YceI